MFKYIHKVTPYLDESRLDLRLNKRKQNIRFLGKVVYLFDQTIVCKRKDKFKYWYKYSNIDYIINNNIITNQDHIYHILTNNILHRKYDKYSLIYPNGDKVWYRFGKIYRNGDKPAKITRDGYQIWYKNGKIHRDGKPAYIGKNGYQAYYQNGVRLLYRIKK